MFCRATLSVKGVLERQDVVGIARQNLEGNHTDAESALLVEPVSTVRDRDT
jgi:hypothetical protein